MDDRDKKEFTSIMYGMGENFGAEVTKDGLRIRFEALVEYDIAKIRQACTAIVKTRKSAGRTMMPTVAEIIEHIDGAPDDVAERQAYAVIEQIRTVGSYGTPKFSDPVTASVMSRRFRWGEVCSTPEKELKWFVKDFVAAYKACRETVPQIESKPPAKLIELAGRIGNCAK